MTEYLFSYGTLQDEKVQRQLFNRKLEGKEDKVKNYTLHNVVIEGKEYPKAAFKENNSIEGVVYAISWAELAQADEYEGKEYQRIKIISEKGKECWMYV